MGLLHPILLEFKGEGGHLFREFGKVRGEIAKLPADANKHMEMFQKASKLAFLGVATAASGMAVESVRKFTEFQEGLTQLRTGAGETEENLRGVGEGMKKIAVDTATGLDRLNEAMFMIESSGFHGKAGLEVLRVAAQGAKVGASDAGTTANALTTVMKNFGTAAVPSMNMMVAAVKNGKMHMQDLAGYFGTAGVTAKAMGYNLRDTLGAFATMTVRGVDAANAATYLRNTMVNLKAPSAAVEGALDDIGISTKSLNDTMNKQGLLGGLMQIADGMKKHLTPNSVEWNQALKDLGGGRKSLLGLLLLQSNTKDLAEAIKNVGGASKSTGDDVEGMSDVQKDAAFKFQRAQQQLNVALIDIGAKITPVVVKVVEWASKHTALVKAVAIGIGVFGAFAGVVWAVNIAMAANPISLTIIAVLALAAGLVYLYNKFAPVRRAMLEVASVGIDGFRMLAQLVLGYLGFILKGLAATFGWLPNGIGSSLKNASKEFDKFKASTDSTLADLSQKLRNKAAAAGFEMSKGLAAGINAGAPDIRSAAEKVVVNGASAMRVVMKIASPSRVTHQIGLDMGDGLTNGLTASTAKVKGAAAAVAQAAADSMSKLKDRAQQIKSDAASLASSLASGLSGRLDLAGMWGAKDGAPGSLSTLRASLQARLASVRAFTADLLTLQRRGIGRGLLEQITGMGPDDGGQLARQLVADKTTAAAINQTFGMIDKVTTDGANKIANGYYAKGAQQVMTLAAGMRSKYPELRKVGDEITGILGGIAGSTRGPVAGLPRAGDGTITVNVHVDGERVASAVQRRNKQYALRNGRGILVT